MVVELRDYQVAAIDALRQGWKRGVRRPLIGLPTGTGKTIIFGTLTASAHARSGWRVLILAHRDELIEQARDKLLMVAPELSDKIGIVKAERNEIDRPIIVASVQSLHAARLERDWPRDRFDMVIVDEAHHAAADSYVRILRHFGCDPVDMTKPKDTMSIGVTATPFRNDSRALADVWDEVVYQRSILDMIADGRLCNIAGKAVRIQGLDLDDVRTSRGDFQDGDLGAHLQKANAPEQVVAAWLEHAAGRKTLCFTPTVALSEEIRDEFVAAGIACEHVDAQTPIDERRAMLRRFASGETLVMTNCGVLTEGFDEPSVQCIVMARPTKSKVLYVQCIGRGTRLHETKQSQLNSDAQWQPGCLVLDLAGAATRHSLISVPKLMGGPDGLDQQVVSLMERDELSVVEAIRLQDNMARSGQLVARQIDLFQQAPVHWFADQQDGKAPVWVLGGSLYLSQTSDDSWAVYEQQGRSYTMLESGLTIDYAKGTAEDRARALNLGGLTKRNARWRNEPASEAQRRFLWAVGERKLARDPELTKGEASDHGSLAAFRKFVGR